MLQNLLTLAQTVLTLFILIGVGFVCEKAKIFSDAAVKCCANLVLYIATPCVIIRSCIRPFDVTMLKGFLLVAVAALLNHLLLIGAAALLFRDKAEGRRRVYRFALIFSNAGYMAIPLQQAILGDDGVFYCAAYVIVFNLVLWTYGVLCMSGDKKELSGRKIVLNPGIIGVVLGLAVFVFSLPIPAPIQGAISSLADLNTPIPMLIVGFYLARTNLKYALSDKKNYLLLVLRLLVLPAVALGLLLLCGVRGDILTSLMICISAPVATATTMFATRYDREPLLSVSLVSMTTLCSIVTMPLMIALANTLSSIL